MKMDVKEILKHVDHTLLTQTATWAEIRQICDDAVKYGTASVCIPPAYVKQVKEYVKDQMQVCTVIGFPNGYMTTATKEFETKDALANGADEIDMVINIGWAKDGKFDAIEEEIRTLKKACGSKILKVIIETCLLTDEEKKRSKYVKLLPLQVQIISRPLLDSPKQEQPLRILSCSPNISDRM